MSEFLEQKELIAWFKDEWPQYEKSIRLSMNGVNLGGGVKAARIINQMKSQGMVKDESDLFFAIPSGGFHGLFIELKDYEKKTTKGQDEYLLYMLEMGYYATSAMGADEAKKIVRSYLTKR